MTNELLNRLRGTALTALALTLLIVTTGCNNYGGSTPRPDDDAGLEKQPPGSVDGSVPLDEDGG